MARGLIGTINDEIASGGTITGDLTVEGDLTIQGSGTSSNYDEVIDGHVQVTSTNKLKFGGSTSSDSDTYILESSADVLDFYAGNVQMLQLLEGGTDYIWSPVDGTIFAMGAGKDLQISISSDDVLIANATQDKDIKFNGDDGGSSITALTLDMSEAGAATFNGDVTVGALLKMPSNTAAKILIGDGTSYEEQSVSGDVSINSSGVVAISSGVILDADVNASAAIAISKTALVAGTNISLSTNTLNVDDVFLVNNGDDTTSGVITSAGYKLTKSDGGGDVSIQFQQGGTTTYTMGIDDAVSSGTADLFKIHSDTALADSSDFIMDKSGNVTIGGDLTVSGDDLYMGTNTGGYILVADGTNFNPVAVSGDVTLASNGAVTIASGAVEHGMLAGSIPDSKLDQITTAGKVALGALEIDGASDIGEALVDADLIIVDNGAGGTEVKCAMSRVLTYAMAGTLSEAAQTNITSLGTLTTLTVDNVIVNGTTIGHTSDTDLMTLASGGLTLAGTLTVGVDDTGHDVKFFGATSGKYMEWDESADKLIVAGTIQTNDLELQNDRGHYLIVEEEEYLSIRNEKTGKLYKFVLEEIDE